MVDFRRFARFSYWRERELMGRFSFSWKKLSASQAQKKTIIAIRWFWSVFQDATDEIKVFICFVIVSDVFESLTWNSKDLLGMVRICKEW